MTGGFRTASIHGLVAGTTIQPTIHAPVRTELTAVPRESRIHSTLPPNFLNDREVCEGKPRTFRSGGKAENISF